MKSSVFALWLATAATAQQSSPVQLAYLLEPGSTFAWSLAIEATVQQQLAERQIDSKMHFVLHFAATVGNQKDGIADVGCKLVRLQARADTQLAKVDYDSQQKDADPGPFAQMKKLVDQVFVLGVDTAGVIHRAVAPAGLDASAREQLGTGDLETLFTPYFMALPAAAVPVGGSWQTQQKLLDPQLAAGGTVTVDNTLTGLDGGVATIARTFQLGRPQRPGIEFEIEKATGSAELDLRTGRLRQSTMELVAKATRKTGTGATVSGTTRVLVQVRPETPPAPQAPPPGR